MKFTLKDEDGVIFEKEAVETTDAPAANDEAEKLQFSAVEVTTLKKLLKYADQLFDLLDGEKGESFEEDEVGIAEDDEEEKDDKTEAKDSCDECECEETEEEEEIIEDTECDSTRACDSKKSFGSVETCKPIRDSEDLDRENEIAQAWAKYYGGR